MINPVSTSKPIELPAKPFLDSASASFFGAAFQENTQQFATLETAQILAKVLGGTVVDLKDQWKGGAQTSQYAIQIGTDGPLLNAGLVATRCQVCGVEAGLSAVMQEIGSLTGKPVSFGDAWALVQKQEAAYAASLPPPATAGTHVASAPVVAPADTATNALDVAPDSTSVASTSTSTVAPQDAPATVQATSTTLSTQAQTDVSPSKLANSAKQFEALMIGQMLKSVREASSNGWMGSDGESSHFSAVEFAEGQLSEAIASRGGFGLAKMVLDSVGRQSGSTAPSSASPAAPQPRTDS